MCWQNKTHHVDLYDLIWKERMDFTWTQWQIQFYKCMTTIFQKGPRLGLNIFNFTIFVSTTKALYNSIRGANSHRFNESLRTVLMILIFCYQSFMKTCNQTSGKTIIIIIKTIESLAKATLTLIPLFGLHEIVGLHRLITHEPGENLLLWG